MAAENERVHKMTKSEDALVVCDLSKNFGSFAAGKLIHFLIKAFGNFKIKLINEFYDNSTEQRNFFLQ